MSKKDVAAIADALTGRGRYGHSPLYWWMWDHFDALGKGRFGRPDWRSATEKFAELGFTGRDGSPLRRESVRKTWARVVQDKDRLSAPAEASTRPPGRTKPSNPPAAPQPPPSLSHPSEEEDGEEEVEFTTADGTPHKVRIPKK